MLASFLVNNGRFTLSVLKISILLHSGSYSINRKADYKSRPLRINKYNLLHVYACIFSITLNKVASWANFVTHQHREQVICFSSRFYTYLL